MPASSSASPLGAPLRAAARRRHRRGPVAPHVMALATAAPCATRALAQLTAAPCAAPRSPSRCHGGGGAVGEGRGARGGEQWRRRGGEKRRGEEQRWGGEGRRGRKQRWGRGGEQR
ncbi:hypothetical protein GQ55_7G022000 [Panicum hallii var. hallii]|uniref:Uncharacterized protein n=1 Tax=Panicum hallii var. hallii TaxID=1504633 RepID=A0A2T7CS01_9POAL|nr:hypothetical protein GQ55_7G022000 [Panicum hallii var. hallii]